MSGHDKMRSAWILPVVILAQFAGTSLWFAGNAVLGQLQALWNLAPTALGLTTAAVQIGFVAGTLCFAVLAISDRFQAARVFFGCSLAGAACNVSIVLFSGGLASLVVLRFLTGFFLAGIYPVGMKLAASWCERGLGSVLGFLVGALVLGTAFPYLLNGLGADFQWRAVLVSVSILAAGGGLAVLVFVPTGPYLPAHSPFDFRAIPRVFQRRKLRAAAFGYFGHMWELYAMWAFIPAAITHYLSTSATTPAIVSLWSFLIIGAGAVGCMAGGLLTPRFGSARVATTQLGISGTLCLLSPFLFFLPPWAFFTALVIWGVVVVGDSPQFSALTAQAAPREYVGTALTIVTCIGFAISAASIQLIVWASHFLPVDFWFLLLVPGPIVGLLACLPLTHADPFTPDFLSRRNRGIS